MSKDQKKAPQKSMKEKRAAKQAKKQQAGSKVENLGKKGK
ncbi:hypothetical protein STH12_04102 [Shewanella khirikhana]|jgi:hypothetical protein|uniref:Small EDRK-rich factor-like N-terminal domain-containing protein n=1 Tax=Shewanella khirikhana TaxID=1965282 RepID=A0ABN5U1E8_9GAMM|nr:hypothetical protein STH12_04102 [Shewanella khirikhana]